MDHIEECGMDEGPMPTPMAPPMDKGQPVTMNVNLTASGKEHVDDLLQMMKQAGLGDAKPVSQDMMPMRTDMERLRDIVDGPKKLKASSGTVNSVGDIVGDGPTDVDRPSSPDTTVGSKAQSMKDEMEGYENEPDEEYGDIEDVTASGDDLHKSKKGYKAAAGGDNPMAMEDIKAQLYAALAEKKAKPDYIDIDGDGDKEEPMKKAVKDKESKKK